MVPSTVRTLRKRSCFGTEYRTASVLVPMRFDILSQLTCSWHLTYVMYALKRGQASLIQLSISPLMIFQYATCQRLQKHPFNNNLTWLRFTAPFFPGFIAASWYTVQSFRVTSLTSSSSTHSPKDPSPFPIPLLFNLPFSLLSPLSKPYPYLHPRSWAKLHVD